MPKRKGPWLVWTAEEDAVLYRHQTLGVSARVTAAELGRSVESVRGRIQSLDITKTKVRHGAQMPAARNAARLTRIVRDDAEVQITAPEATADETAEAFLERVLRQTSREVEQAQAERYVSLRIASAEPIALSISSDWHLSVTGATDVQGLLDYADAIRQTPRAYAVGVGDLIDNPIKHRPTAANEVSDELRLLDVVVGRFGGRLLATTSGNHDDWTKAFAGVDNLRNLAEKHRIHYAPDELIYLLEIVDPTDPESVTARWVVATRHQYRRHSNLNHTHACWRWLEEMQGDWPHDDQGSTQLPDVLAIGHNHVAAVETRSTPRGDVIACRMGSWQVTSPFTRQRGYAGARPTAPTVVFPSMRDGSRHPVGYADYRDALRALRGPV